MMRGNRSVAEDGKRSVIPGITSAGNLAIPWAHDVESRTMIGPLAEVLRAGSPPQPHRMPPPPLLHELRILLGGL